MQMTSTTVMAGIFCTACAVNAARKHEHRAAAGDIVHAATDGAQPTAITKLPFINMSSVA